MQHDQYTNLLARPLLIVLQVVRTGKKKRIFVSVNLFRTGFWVISIGMAVGSVLRIA